MLIMFCRRLFFSHILALKNSTMSSIRNQSHRPTIGVLQMTSTADKQANFNQAKELIEKAKNKGAEMVFLPECFDLMGSSTDEAFSLAETIEGDIISRYRTLAKELKLWLSLGGFHEKSADPTEKKIHNTHLMINDSGDICARYSKIHMFDVEGAISLTESCYTRPGDRVVAPVSTAIGNVAMAIDLRFPELSLAHSQMGAEVLTFPSAFTVPTGLAHWQVLLRSRAIENQCYVVAAAQVGRHHAKRTSYGHAMVVDPWGSVIAQCHDQVDVCTAEIDLDYLRKRRTDMPVWQHRRCDLYGQIVVNTAAADIDAQKTYTFGIAQVPSSSVFYRTPLSYAFVNRKPVLPGPVYRSLFAIHHRWNFAMTSNEVDSSNFACIYNVPYHKLTFTDVLVAPLRLSKRLSELTNAEVADMFCCAQKVSDCVTKRYGATAVTVAIQDGRDAGQTVPHVHAHVLPRKACDFERNDDIYEHLVMHDKNDNAAHWRTAEDMAREATALRTYFK